VAAGTALLCALPAVIAVLPVSASPISAAALRARILASARVPYEGYAESTVDLGLPEDDYDRLLDDIPSGPASTGPATPAAES